MSRWGLFSIVLLGTLAVFSLARAEEGDKPSDRGKEGAAGSGGQSEQGRERRRNRVDSAEMRERVLNGIKEQLGASDDEWKALHPKVEKVMTHQRNLRPVMAGLAGRSRTDGGDQPQSKTGETQHDLRTALENKSTSADDIAKKLTALREAREKARTELQTAQKDLKGAVNARQEAVLVLYGALD